jgi:site-specific DNA recombinase
MPVALDARVSASQPPHDGTPERQRCARQHHIQPQGWARLPGHESRADGVSGARLDRPALERLRDAARRGECGAVGSLSPARRARTSAPPWLLPAAFAKRPLAVRCRPTPCGDSPQGNRRTQVQGMRAADERAPSTARTRRGRLATARRGACRPWACRCSGYRSLPTRHGDAPHVALAPAAAAGGRGVARL